MAKKVIGILGGMGPEATVDFMSKIIYNTPAKIDQEHLRILVDNNPQVPDRTKAISKEGESCGPVLAEMARNLEKWGADLLAMPCNTAHYFADFITEAVKIPFVNMIEETANTLVENGVKKVALLATDGTLRAGLYHQKLQEAGIELVVPSEEYQEKVMRTIAGVKAGDYKTATAYKAELVDHVVARGAEAIILGCTELPIAFKDREGFNITFYDPTDILAKAVVKKAIE